MAAAAGGGSGGGGADPDPHRIRSDLWTDDPERFRGGPGGFGTAAWDAKDVREANPVPRDGGAALRAAIGGDVRLSQVPGQFDRMLQAEQSAANYELQRPYRVDESAAGGRARVAETQQMLKTTAIVSHQPGTARAYDTLVKLAGLDADDALDTRPGALAARMHLIFGDDHVGALDMLASVLYYYDIPLLHVLPSLYEYSAAPPGVYVKGSLAPLKTTQALLLDMMARKVHSAAIIGACIKAPEFNESAIPPEVDPSLEDIAIAGAGPWKQGTVDRRPWDDANVVQELDSSRSELFLGLRTAIDALAIALRLVYVTELPYFNKLVIASTEYASGGAHECLKNPRKKGTPDHEYPGRGCQPALKSEHFGCVVLLQLTTFILEMISPPAVPRAQQPLPPGYEKASVLRSLKVEAPPPALPSGGGGGGGNLAKLAFGQGAASALYFLGNTQHGQDAKVKLIRSPQCMMALQCIGSRGKWALLEHISQSLHNGTDADLSRTNNLVTMFVVFAFSLYPLRQGESDAARKAAATSPCVGGGGDMDTLRAYLAMLGVSAFLNLCRILTAGIAGPCAISENRILPDGARALNTEGHRYLKSAARVPGTYLLDPTQSALNHPKPISRLEAMRGIKLQSLLRCPGFHQLMHVINQFNRNGSRNMYSSGSYEVDIGPAARARLRTVSNDPYAGKGGNGSMSKDRQADQITARWNTFVAAAAHVARKTRANIIPVDDGDFADNLCRYCGEKDSGGGFMTADYEHGFASRFLDIVYSPGDTLPTAAWASLGLNPWPEA